MTLVTGVRIGPYAIVAPLGAGGMGEVYRAKDTRLDRTVAVKILPRHIAENPARRQRFEREARAISSLSHPHICALFDVGEQDAVPFLVMEHLEGETLARRLVRGPLPIEQAVGCAIEIAEALEHAHRLRIIHRDLKPTNIMLTRSGVKLLDFGVAKLWAPEPVQDDPLAGGHPAETLTEEGTVVGTLQYMAPEQLEGREVDARTDLFAFGAVIYEMLTGRPAFAGKSHSSVVAKILAADLPPLSVARNQIANVEEGELATGDPIPPLLDRIVARCLAKDPENRWQTAGDLRQALKWVLDSSAEIAKPSLPRADPAWRRARLAWVAAGIGLAIASLATLALVMTPASRAAGDGTTYRFEVGPPEDTNFGLSPAVMSVSPDGRALAFHANSREGISSIWVRPLDSLVARKLPGTEGSVTPIWSDDSRFVLFGADGKLKRIDVSGGIPQTVLEVAPVQTEWNSDGVLLFKPDPRGNIFQRAPSGGAETAATTLDQSRAEISHTRPQFLPDGRHFLYHALSSQPEHDGWVFVGSIDSPNVTRLVKTDTHAVYAPPGYLLYLYSNTLVAHAFDAKTRRFTAEPVPIVENVDYNNVTRRGAFSVSNTGTLVYRSPAETQLVWFDRTGRELGPIGPLARYKNPALSPNEQQVVVDRVDPNTGTTDIWLIDLARGSRSRLTSDPAQDQYAIWSPDGQRVVFLSNRGGTSGLYQTSSASADQDEMLLAALPGEPRPLDWTRDGRILIYSARVEGPHIAEHALWQLPLFGDRRASQFQQAAAWGGHSQLSPDGRWTAYVSDESGRREVYVRPFPSGEGRSAISTNGGIEPRWRGDGRELFYLGLDQSLMSVAVTTTASTIEAAQPERLFSTRMLGFTGTNTRNQYAVTADGQRFLINQPPQGTNSSPLTVVVNWTDALKKNQP